MKKLLFFLLISCLSYSQNNFYVEYNLKISKEEGLFKNNDYLKQMLDKSISNEQPILFKLEIKDSISKFSRKKNSSENSSENVINFAISIANYTGAVYNMNNDSIVKQSSLLGNNFYSKSPGISNWQITNETKLIDNYLCYKATNTYKVVNYIKTFNHPVIAWFCPSLPYKYGPNGYGNLPGLILELQVRNTTYGAKIISTDKIVNFDLKFLKKAIILSEEDIEKKIMETNNFEKLK